MKTKQQPHPKVRTRPEVKAQASALDGRRSRAALAAVEDELDVQSEELGTVGELWLYGLVGGWWRGFDAESVANALRGMDVDTLFVRIHSPGGHASDGIAIGNLLRNHKARVIVVVDGLAASAASVIAIAGDEIVMCPGSQMMLHDASTYAYGNAADLREFADYIDGQSANYAGVYAYRAGGTAEQWRVVMQAKNGWGTYYTAEDAVAAGLADSVGTRPAIGSPPVAPEDELDDDDTWARAAHDLELLDQFVHPAARAAWQGEPPKPPSASAVGSPKKEGASLVDFNDEQIATLREQAGFPEDADAETITAALVEALNERADTPPGDPVPEGHVVIPAAKLKDLETGAAAGVDASQKLRAKERDAFLDANKGKFAPANRDAWAKEYDRDPVSTAKHFETAPVLVSTEEIGHAEDTETDSPTTLAEVQADTTYQTWSVN